MKILSLLLCMLLLSFTLNAQNIPRPEHPRPQLERTDWINLNGTWTFTFDFGKSGMDRKLFESKGFDKNILVPFCPESKMSGVEHVDFINAMWYHRSISIPANWSDKRIILHFGGVDYYAGIYIDGRLAGTHWGGSSPFDIDITNFVKPGGKHELVLQVEDDQRNGLQGNGKQSREFYSHGGDYTRTTGIWQTVWLEAIHPTGLKNIYVVPDLDQKRFVVNPEYYTLQSGQKLRVNIKDGQKTVSSVTVLAGGQSSAILQLKEIKTWSPESPFLYDIELDVLDANGKVIDHVKSYAGMRKVHIEGNKLYLNNRPRYLRFVLDQGYYPTGVWTAPTDEDFKKDIELSMAAGFNGARLHQKVFEDRYYYWADKLGYLTWSESCSSGTDPNNPLTARNFFTEWTECVKHFRNHPSIIGWVPVNESGRHGDGKEYNRFIRDMYELTHSLDYRPVNDASGWTHVVTDIWSVHTYHQDPEEYRKQLTLNDKGMPFQNEYNITYSGQPYYVDEWGGIKWVVGEQYAANTWGYGNAPKTEEEYYERLKGLVDVMLDQPHIVGHCYTQFTDIEQEQNGIYNYDRTAKFDMKRIKSILERKPEGFD